MKKALAEQQGLGADSADMRRLYSITVLVLAYALIL